MTDSISNHAMRSAWGCQNNLAWKYVILHSKWRNTCFTVWLKKILFRNDELMLKITFIKTAKIFFKIYQFFTKYAYSVGFSFMWWEIFSSIEWSEKNIKISKLRKWPRFFWKFWKWIFSKRPPLNFFIFFGGLSIICTAYPRSLASGKQFLPIEKNIFRKKIKIVSFFKNYRRKG